MSNEYATTGQQWKAFFEQWPTQILRRGIVTSVLNETMPFKGFMTKGDLLLLDRTNPDALGGRFILLPYDAINSVKFVDPLKEADVTAAGFQGRFA